MKKAVHFGAGKIGKGFIGDLLHDSGYAITFIDVIDDMIADIKKNKEYTLFKINHNYEEKTIDQVDGYSSIKEPEAAIKAICEANIITTSVMAVNLPKIAPFLAEALKIRLTGNNSKVIVMACENAILGTDILKKAMVNTGRITMNELDMVGYYPNTAVDRMVFEGKHNGKTGIEVGDAMELAIEKNKWPVFLAKPIKKAEYVNDLMMYLQRKIYIVNCGHAISAYLGKIKRKTTVQEVLHDKKLVEEVRNAMIESARALEAEYGFTHESLMEYMETMVIQRHTVPGLADPIERVAREPQRKLSPNDRILGPALLCEKHGLPNEYLLKGAAYALNYYDSQDIQSVEIQHCIAERGIEEAITMYTGLKKGTLMFEKIGNEYKKL